MLKRVGLATLALAGLLAFGVPRKADAQVRFGVTFGAPVYSHPYAYGYSYYGYPAYGYPAYAYPSYGYFGGGGRHWRGHEWREHERHEHGWHR